VSQDDLFGAPAGWYPDPLGLPQLRWWNNHAWTEQTSAARQPMVVQDTKFAWADDELPSRREERERERQRDDRKPAATKVPTAETLRELEPPRAFTKIDETSGAPAAPLVVEPEPAVFSTAAPTAPAAASFESLYTQEPVVETPAATQAPFDASAFDAKSFDATAFGTQQAAAPTAPAAKDTSFGSLFDTTAAPTAPATEPASESLDALFGAETATRRSQKRTAPIISQAPIQQASGGKLVSSTGPAWIIAMVPLFQLVLSLLFLTAFNLGNNLGLFVAILVVPYFVVIGLAYFDHKQLLAAGHERPAHWAFAALTAPVYLLVRARAVIRQTGHGIGPVLVWFGLGLLHIVSVVAVPGLLIALLPAVFTAQIEQSVARDASLMGGSTMTVSCPVTPPLLPGQEIECDSLTAAGTAAVVTVTLDRVNGWVGWRVTDWGVFSL